MQMQKWLTGDITGDITGAHLSMGGSSQARNLGAVCTAFRQLDRLESVLPRCLGSSKPPPGSVSFFQAAGLASESPLSLACLRVFFAD